MNRIKPNYIFMVGMPKCGTTTLASCRAQHNGDIQVPSVRLDNVLDDITLLKMDVEGHEAKVPHGARRLIEKCRPRMAITCYHLLDIVAEVEQICSGTRLRLRHYSMFFYNTIPYVEWPTSHNGDKGTP